MPRDRSRADGHEQVDRRGEPQRRTRAVELEHEEGRDEAASDGAERVGGVQCCEIFAAAVALACHGARCRRKRTAHGDGWDGQHQNAENQALDRRDRHAEARRTAGDDVHRADGGEEQRAERCRDGHDPFQGRVEQERPRMAIDARAEQQAAGAKAADEDREHRGRGRRARAEDQTELAEPADLVDQRAEAGAEEERRDWCRARSHLSVSAPTRASARRRRRRPAARARRAPAGTTTRRPSALPPRAGSASRAPRSPLRGRAIRPGGASRR